MADYSMSRSNYLKLMYGKVNQEINSLTNNTINAVGDTSYQSAEIFAIQQNNQNAIDNAQKYLNENSIHTDRDRNGWQRFWDAIGETTNDIIEGLANFADDIYDFGLYAGAELDLIDKDYAFELAQADWQAQFVKATNVINPAFYLNGDAFTKDFWTGWDSTSARAQMQQTADSSLWNELGEDGHRFVKNLGQGIGYMVPTLVAGALTGGASAGVQAVATLGTTAVGAFTGGVNDTYEKTGNYGKSLLVGAEQAIIEVGSELVVGKALGAIGAGTGKIAGAFGKGTSQTADNFVKTMAKTMFEEGVEEAFSAVMQPVVESTYKGKEAFRTENGKFIYFDKDFWWGKESVAEQALLGATMGGILGGANVMIVGPDVMSTANLLEENRSLYNDLSKYEKGSAKYNELLEQISKNTAKIAYYVDKVFKGNNSRYKNNMAKLLSDPLSLKKALETKNVKEVNKLINNRIKELANPHKVGTRNLFNELQSRFNTDYELEFGNANGQNAYVDRKNKKIVINENISDEYAGALAHEYLGHAIVDGSIDQATRQKMFESVVKSDWFKKYNKKLRENYIEKDKNYQSLETPEQKKLYWQSEVINNYLEDLFKKGNTAKSVKMINDVFLRNTLLNRMLAFFNKKNNLNLIKNNSFLSEFTKSVKTILDSTNKNVSRALDRFVKGETLNKTEENYYKKYKAIFDNAKLAYSKNLVDEFDMSPQKIKYSKSLDSAGNKLTEQQSKFFENSKVRDDKGNLLVVYHGTRQGGFTIFDSSKKGYHDKNVVFFTDSLDVAKSYAGNGEVLTNSKLNGLENLNKIKKDIYNEFYKIKTVDKLVDFINNKFEYVLNNYYRKNTYKQEAKIQDGDVILTTFNETKEIRSKKIAKEKFVEWYKAIYEDYIEALKENNNYSVYPSYLNIENPLVVDCNGQNWYDIKISKNDINDINIYNLSKGKLTTDGLVDEVQRKYSQYDGIILKNVVDGGIEKSNVYVTLKSPNQIKSVDNTNPTSNEDIRYSKKLDVAKVEESSYNEIKQEEVSDEFRKLQEECRKLSEEVSFSERSKSLDDSIYGRIKRVLSRQIGLYNSRNSNSTRLLKNTNNFEIYENIDGDLFHDCFEIARTYLLNGELVDLHDNYNDSTCYLSKDGLSGFAITQNGDLISVFNLSKEKGFLRAIAPVIKSKAKTLDCFISSKQNLQGMYEAKFGFKTASVMDHNMEYDHDDIAKNHNNPKVAFMVNTDKIVETKNFDKDSYDQAQAYQQSFINKTNNATDNHGNKLTEQQSKFFENSKVRDENGNLLVVYHGSFENFNVFDMSFSRTENYFGKGFYFTTSAKDVKENYLNPSSGKNDVNVKIEDMAYDMYVEAGYNYEDLEHNGEAIDFYNECYDKAIEHYSKNGKMFIAYLNMTNPLYVKKGKVSQYVLVDSKGSSYDMNNNTIRWLSKQQIYDGIIDNTVSEKFPNVEKGTTHYIVFKSNQIKLTSNLNPTSSEDIRYSKRLDSDGQELSVEQAKYFENSKIRDENGALKVMYHGTQRMDRVGNKFDPARATSGPMAYFTDNKEIATNYSTDKKDTSIAYEEEYDSYNGWYRLKGNEKVTIDKVWYKLSYKQKQEIIEKAKHITFDDQGENIIYDPKTKNGAGNFDIELRENGNNALSALVGEWLNSGNLFNEEHRFMEVLKFIGIDNMFEYRSPYEIKSGVYEVYLNVTNPFDTSKLTKEFVDKIKDISPNVDDSNSTLLSGADMWDKNNPININRFKEKLAEDFEKGTSLAWTSIPDYVSDYLKAEGYDGIVDTGGKYREAHGGKLHTVVIPFYPNQIKNINNLNPTESDDIRYSKRLDSEENPLTEAQERYFKDSKFVDEEGNLLILYHGSDTAGFMEFDNENGIYFFTPEYDVARSYTETYNTVVTKSFKTADELIDWWYEGGAEEVGKENVDILSKNDAIEEINKALSTLEKKAGKDSELYKIYKKRYNEAEYIVLDEEYSLPLSYSEEQLIKEYISSIQEYKNLDENYEAENRNYDDEDYERKTNNIYKVYVNVKNPAIINCRGAKFTNILFKGQRLSTDEIAKIIKEEGKYDGIIFKNVVDNGKADMFDELGMGNVYVAFESNQIKAVDNLKPTSNPDIRYSKRLGTTALSDPRVTQKKGQVEDLHPFEKNQSSIIKEAASEKLGKKIRPKDTRDIYDAIQNSLQATFGDSFKIRGKNYKARRLFEEYNLSKNNAKKDKCKKFVADIIEQKIVRGVTYREYLQYNNENVDDLIEQGTELLYGMLNARAVDSDVNKMLDKFNKIIDKLKQAKLEQAETFKFMKKLNSIRNNLSKHVTKYGNTGQLDTTSGIKGLFYSYFSKFRFTRANYLSLTNIHNLQNMIQDGSFKNLINSILNPYNEVTNLSSLQAQAETIVEMAEELANSLTQGQKHLNYDQIVAFNNLNKAVYHLYKEYTSGVLEATREQALKLQGRAKEVSRRKSTNKAKNKLKKAVLDAMSPKEIIAEMVGGTHTEEFNLIYNDLYRKPYERQIDKYVDFLKERDKCIKNIQKEMNKKVKVGNLTVRKYVLFQFYLNTLSPDNLIRMKNSNLTYTEDGITKRISFNDLEVAMNKYIKPAEKADLDNLFKLYNTSVKKYVEKISEKNLGFKTSRDNYYPIVASEVAKNQDLSNPNKVRYNINAMNNGRLKKLSNKNTTIEININPIHLFDSYIESMTITGEIGLESQKLNRLFQLKDNNGNSFSSIVNEYVPHAKDIYIPSIFNKLIGNTQTIQRSSLLDKMVGKFSTATLGLNIRSMLKQIGSFFTAWEKVGIGTGFKVMLNPKAIKRIFKNRAYLKANNPVFKLRTHENGYVRGATLSAGATQFGSNVMQTITNASLKGIEAMDRLTCYATFTLCEEYVKKTHGYEIGSDENLKLANEMFSEMILETQSNSDRISMSRVRSGEKGAIVKNLFGLFQSDAQNKAGLLFNIRNDIRNINKDIIDVEAKIKNTTDPEAKKKLEDNRNILKRARTQAYARMRAYATGLLLSGIAVALADKLADYIYDKEDPKDTELSEVLMAILGNTTIDWIPYLNQIANWWQYDGVEISALEMVNDLLETIKGFTDGEVSSQDFMQAIIQLATVCGLPLNNLNKLVQGTISNFDPEAGIKYKSLFYNMSQSYLGRETNSYIENGNIDKARASLSLNFSLYKFEADDELTKELVLFKQNGINISIKNTPTEITDAEGKVHVFTEEEMSKFRNIYSGVNVEFKKMKADNIYQKLSMEEKAKAVKKLTDLYFDKAKGEATSKLAMLASKNIPVYSYILIMTQLQEVKGKDNFIKEINKIRTLNKKEKLLLMSLMGYSVSELSKPTLLRYLRELGLSSKEIEKWGEK